MDLSGATEAAWRGDLARAEALLRCSADASDAAALTLQAHRALAQPDRAVPPSCAEVRSYVDGSPEARAAAAAACLPLAHLAILRFDARGLDEVREAHRALTDGRDPLAHAWQQTLATWQALMRGNAAEAALLSGELATKSEVRHQAALAIEVSSLHALAHASGGDLAEALRAARRASRMARTEALPQLEYLAHATLARIRRLTGQFHLAARILTALRAIAPSPWHALIDWELGFAGHSQAAEAPILRVFDRATHGDAEGFARASEELRACAGGFADFRAEADALLVATDPRTGVNDGSAALASWLRGEVPLPPYALHGSVTSVQRAGREGGFAWVVARPDVPARRVLEPGLGLVSDAALLDTPQRRAKTAAATLALAGPEGLGEAAFFARVYGFAYDSTTHAGVLGVLLHRVRQLFGEAATLHRAGGHLELDVLAPFCVPDPRTAIPIAAQVLQLIASQPGATARDAAAQLRVPLRSVQIELQQLVADGACIAAKDGRRLTYRVEDTTFSEPTRS